MRVESFEEWTMLDSLLPSTLTDREANIARRAFTVGQQNPVAKTDSEKDAKELARLLRLSWEGDGDIYVTEITKLLVKYGEWEADEV